MSETTVEGRRGYDVGIGTVFSDAIAAIQNRPEVIALVLAGSVLGNVPLVGWVFSILFSGVATAAAVRGLAPNMVTERSLGGRLLSLFGASLAAGVAVLLGLLLLVLPGIYVAVRLALLPAEVMAGGRSALDALSATWGRTRGKAPTVFAWQLLVGLPTFLIAFAIVFASLGAGVAPFGTLGVQALASVVTAPIGAVGLCGIAAMWTHFGR